jgi:hypothetical protein
MCTHTSSVNVLCFAKSRGIVHLLALVEAYTSPYASIHAYILAYFMCLLHIETAIGMHVNAPDSLPYCSSNTQTHEYVNACIHITPATTTSRMCHSHTHSYKMCQSLCFILAVAHTCIHTLTHMHTGYLICVSTKVACAQDSSAKSATHTHTTHPHTNKHTLTILHMQAI